MNRRSSPTAPIQPPHPIVRGTETHYELWYIRTEAGEQMPVVVEYSRLRNDSPTIYAIVALASKGVEHVGVGSDSATAAQKLTKAMSDSGRTVLARGPIPPLKKTSAAFHTALALVSVVVSVATTRRARP